jgi:DNA-directed RNA polymerase subunit M/transcription elongation factor TFIIS
MNQQQHLVILPVERQEQDDAILMCDQCLSFEPHSWDHQESFAGEGKAEMYACQQCGHTRRWGTVG